MVTSSGIRSSSIKRRRKLNSVSDAAGKPTSISLKPISTNILKYSSFSSKFIGIIKAWFPSLKSTLHQIGGSEMYSFFVQSKLSTGGIKYPLVYLLLFSILHAPLCDKIFRSEERRVGNE